MEPMEPPPLDLENIGTYAEAALVFCVLGVGSYLYALRVDAHWIGPAVIIAHAVVLSAAAFYRNRGAIGRRGTPEALSAGFVWLLWLVYGMMFHDVIDELPRWAARSHSLLIVGAVAAVYWREDAGGATARAGAASFVALLLLFFPHPDATVHGMANPVLFAKTLGFFAIYFVGELREKMTPGAKASSPEASRVLCSDGFRFHVRWVRCAWVLLCSKYLVALCVPQFVVLSVGLYRTAKNLPKKRRTGRPRAGKKPKLNRRPINFAVELPPIGHEVV